MASAAHSSAWPAAVSPLLAAELAAAPRGARAAFPTALYLLLDRHDRAPRPGRRRPLTAHGSAAGAAVTGARLGCGRRQRGPRGRRPGPAAPAGRRRAARVAALARLAPSARDLLCPLRRLRRLRRGRCLARPRVRRCQRRAARSRRRRRRDGPAGREHPAAGGRPRGCRARPHAERRRRPVRSPPRPARRGRWSGPRGHGLGRRRGPRSGTCHDEPVGLLLDAAAQGYAVPEAVRASSAPPWEATRARPAWRCPPCWRSATPLAPTSSPGSPAPSTPWPPRPGAPVPVHPPPPHRRSQPCLTTSSCAAAPTTTR